MLGLTGFSVLVIVCLILTALAPIVLVALWLKDFISQQLW